MREHSRVGSYRFSSIEGFSPRQRAHHAIIRDGVVVSELLPDGPEAHLSRATLDERLRNDPSLAGAERVFIPHEQEYIVKSGKKLRTYRHGMDDGLSNQAKNLPPLPGVMLEVGLGFSPDRSRIRHDWQEAPYRNRGY